MRHYETRSTRVFWRMKRTEWSFSLRRTPVICANGEASCISNCIMALIQRNRLSKRWIDLSKVFSGITSFFRWTFYHHIIASDISGFRCFLLLKLSYLKANTVLFAACIVGLDDRHFWLLNSAGHRRYFYCLMPKFDHLYSNPYSNPSFGSLLL